eukprot:11272175-Karenia_brevis.AAC.1
MNPHGRQGGMCSPAARSGRRRLNRPNILKHIESFLMRQHTPTQHQMMQAALAFVLHVFQDTCTSKKGLQTYRAGGAIN